MLRSASALGRATARNSVPQGKRTVSSSATPASSHGGSSIDPTANSAFATPPFAGFVSGHSTFSRAAAEVMTLFTGDPFFPGGLGEFVAPADTYIPPEKGPTQPTALQWATYYDAADQAGISRIWSGIHVRADDIPGRVIGAQVGIDAYAKALTYFDGTAVP